MSEDVLWLLKTNKVVDSVKQGKRLDNRKFDEYRKIEVVKDVSQNAEGSARVKFGETEVIAGVKFVLGKPYPDSPDSGSMGVNAEMIPIASPEFETGFPSGEAIELSRVVDRGIRNSGTLDFKKFCITEGELAYIAFIDIYTINFDGNLFDACSLAAVNALNDCKIPKVEDEQIVKGEYAGKLKLKSLPVLTTFAKIGDKILFDTDLAEEKALNARFSIASIEKDIITGTQKGGKSGFNFKELSQAIETSMVKAKELRKYYK
ncbi:MAG: exosome complex protein Rrp42 [archaeon]